ncbi:hypothetical protein LTR66_017104 [Elasticomyces elasticus]|nr:hypothetical protein LTR66_017104 [Elasticomyces elasticus]
MVSINAGGFAAAITILILAVMGAVGIILTKISRRRQDKQEADIEQAQLPPLPTPTITEPKPLPILPVFRTRASLSMPSSPISPRTPKPPSIKFLLHSPSHRSKNSDKDLPSIETVVDEYELDPDMVDMIKAADKLAALEDKEAGEAEPICCDDKFKLDKAPADSLTVFPAGEKEKKGEEAEKVGTEVEVAANKSS